MSNLSMSFINKFFKRKADNALHFAFAFLGTEIIGTIIGLFNFFQFDIHILLSSIIAFILVLSKELYDKKQGGKFSLLEIIYGCIGISLWVALQLIGSL